VPGEVARTRRGRPPAPRGPAWPAGPAGHALAFAPAVAAAALVHGPALFSYFALDDIGALARVRGLEPTPWPAPRPIANVLAWHALHAAFGADPLPYFALLFALHLAACALVYAMALAAARTPWAAGLAAVLFASSSIAFTPLRWFSAVGDVLVVVFGGAAALLVRAAAARGRTGPAWLAAGAVLLAMLSKETAAALPLALLAALWRPGAARGWWRPALPSLGAAAAFVAAFVAAVRATPYGGPAYAFDLSPRHLATNLATYLAWTVRLDVPIRDLVASAQPAAWPAGIAAGAALLALAWPPWAAARAGERAGLAWWLALLAPVLVLGRQTYLYYLYAPWAGLCVALAALAARLARRLPARAGPVAAAAIAVAFTGVEFASVRARAAARVGDLPVDRTVSAGTTLRHAVEGLRAAGVAAGDSVGFVNPWPRAYVDRAGGTLAVRRRPSGGASYLPFAAALQGGRAIAVLMPGVRVLGFEESIPAAWGEARIFQFENDGRLTALGRGPDALAAYAGALTAAGRWDLLEDLSRRRLAAGDASPDPAFDLLYAIAGQGRDAEARAAAAAFVRAFPDDRRSARLDSMLRRAAR